MHNSIQFAIFTAVTTTQSRFRMLLILLVFFCLTTEGFAFQSINSDQPLFQPKNEFSPIIHHIFWQWSELRHDEMFHEKLQIWIENRQWCMQRAPNFQHIMWNYTMIKSLLQSHYAWMLPIFDSYTFPVQRLDVAKYFILHRYGGIYMDMDVGCRDLDLEKIFDYVRANNVYAQVAFAKTKPFGYATDVIISTPVAPFWLHLFSNLQRYNHWYIFPYATVMYSTGPLFFSRQVYEYKQTAAYSVQRDMFYVFDENDYTLKFFRHSAGDTWHSWDYELFTFISVWGWAMVLYLAVICYLCNVCNMRKVCRRLFQSFMYPQSELILLVFVAVLSLYFLIQKKS